MRKFSSYRRFQHDLYWGYRLYLMRLLHTVSGFRGAAKGKGFSAYLAAEGIPRRLAYRRIEFYMRVVGMMACTYGDNYELEKEVRKIHRGPLGIDEIAFVMGMRLGAIRRSKEETIRDKDSVTNAENANA